MLTRLGWGVGITGALTLTTGWLADTPELVAVGLACLVAVLQGFGWMLARADLLAVREIEPTRVSEGDPARALLLVQNLSRWRSPLIVATDRVGGTTLTLPVPSLPAGAAHTTTYPLPTNHRGVFLVGPFSIGHADPLRLVTASRTYPSSTLLTVHPRVDRVAPVPTGVTRDMEGQTSANSPRGGIAFHSIRPYSVGDSFRDVHWKKSAQTGELMVCHKVVPDEPSLMVVLDTSAAAYRDDAGFEDAVRIAASLCVAATSGGYPLELRTTGGAVAVSEAGIHDEPELLDLLAGVCADPADPGLTAAARFVPSRAAVSLGVVTGHPAAEQLAVLPQIRHSYLMVTAVLVGEGATGRSLPGVFALTCRDSDDFARRWNEQLGR